MIFSRGPLQSAYGSIDFSPAIFGSRSDAAGPSAELMPDKRLLVPVADDESVVESLPDPPHEFGYSARTFSSASEFLASDALHPTSCLLLDIAMPVMTGVELLN